MIAHTDKGRKAFERYRDPEEFEREADRLYKQWKASLPEESEEVDEVPTAAVTLEESEEMAWR